MRENRIQIYALKIAGLEGESGGPSERLSPRVIAFVEEVQMLEPQPCVEGGQVFDAPIDRCFVDPAQDHDER